MIATGRISTACARWPLLLVLLFHAFPSLVTGGFHGDIFFVISGFPITGILRNEAARRHLQHRALPMAASATIVPALLVVLGQRWPPAGICWSPAELHSPSWQVIGSALFSAANIFFWMNAGCFDARPSQTAAVHLVAGGRGAVLPGVALPALHLAQAPVQPGLGGRGAGGGVDGGQHRADRASPLGGVLPAMSRLWELSIGAMLTSPASPPKAGQEPTWAPSPASR